MKRSATFFVILFIFMIYFISPAVGGDSEHPLLVQEAPSGETQRPEQAQLLRQLDPADVDITNTERGLYLSITARSFGPPLASVEPSELRKDAMSQVRAALEQLADVASVPSNSDLRLIEKSDFGNGRLLIRLQQHIAGGVLTDTSRLVFDSAGNLVDVRLIVLDPAHFDQRSLSIQEQSAISIAVHRLALDYGTQKIVVAKSHSATAAKTAKLFFRVSDRAFNVDATWAVGLRVVQPIEAARRHLVYVDAITGEARLVPTVTDFTADVCENINTQHMKCENSQTSVFGFPVTTLVRKIYEGGVCVAQPSSDCALPRYAQPNAIVNGFIDWLDGATSNCCGSVGDLDVMTNSRSFQPPHNRPSYSRTNETIFFPDPQYNASPPMLQSVDTGQSLEIMAHEAGHHVIAELKKR